MIQKLKNKLVVISSLLTLLAPMTVGGIATAATADPTTNLNCGSNLRLDNANCNLGDPDTSLSDKIATVINVLSVIIGVVAVIMIIIAGFRYIASGGKQESVQGAKNTILYAVIGLVIVALAQLIVHFVLQKAEA